MRELKFRAWVNTEKKMYYGDNDLEAFFRDFEGWDIMQFTGLKDKNGKDVFEGDITAASKDAFNRHLVIFEDGCFQLVLATGRQTLKDASWRGHFMEEVIGNIYENPELLKE